MKCIIMEVDLSKFTFRYSSASPADFWMSTMINVGAT